MQMKPLPPTPHTTEDIWIWFDVLARFRPVSWAPVAVSGAAFAADRRDAGLMRRAQRCHRIDQAVALALWVEDQWIECAGRHSGKLFDIMNFA